MRFYIPLRIAFSYLLFQESSLSTFALQEDSEHSSVTYGQSSKDCNVSNALEEAFSLVPPVATSVQGGDTEGSEWWLEHEELLQSAWKQWDDCISEAQGLPSLDATLIDADLRLTMDRTRQSPNVEHEVSVRENWETVLSSNLHRVYRYKNFMTPEGIQKLRSHLDALSSNGIPKRRPNAMNRNGLLLDPTVPGGVSGDLELQNFIEQLASEYLRPLGRSLFPEFAGNANDDTKHYAFTIKYGVDENHSETAEDTQDKAQTRTETSKDSNNVADWDLKEHSDASVYTLNINLNLPDEEYSGSSLYFVTEQDNAKSLTEIQLEPGTALLHRGMTKHGARPLEGGKRNNLIIWLHGNDGYVRVAPYEEKERLSLEQRWTSERQNEASTTNLSSDIGWKAQALLTNEL